MTGTRGARVDGCPSSAALAVALLLLGLLASGCSIRENCSSGSCSDDDESAADDDNNDDDDAGPDCIPEGEVSPSCTEDKDCASWPYGTGDCGAEGTCTTELEPCPPGDDDDLTFEDEPEFLATYDFTLVMRRNEPTGEYGAIQGTMDVSLSTTDVLAELTTDSGASWTWAGPVEDNATHFLVRGYMVTPGASEETFVEVSGNFLVNADGTPSSEDNCVVGLGSDDDPNFPDQGIEFAWYGCRQDAGPPAQDRSGNYSLSVTVHSDFCGNAWGGVGFVGTWQEYWQFDGRQLVVSRDGHTGYGVISDDGNVFQFTMVEEVNPGRSLVVIGDFTNPNNTTEARGLGYCHVSETIPGSVIDMDYP